MRLASLDLFSGIGGITHALKGFCTPVAYCDWEKDSTAVLERNMVRKLLPRAPISEDVRQIDAAWFKENHIKRVDIVVGGFPCVGFSPLGARQGVENEQTGLFFEIMRILDITRSPFVFLENVPNLLTLGMDIVTHELVRRGYEIRWCVVSAAQLGARHMRKRWFCLCVKPQKRVLWQRIPAYKSFSWRGQGPSRSIPKDSAKARVRTSLLGNSVVPDAVRYAFIFLLDRCSHTQINCHSLSPSNFQLVPATKPTKKYRKKRAGEIDSYPVCGILCADGELQECKPPTDFSKNSFTPIALVFDPKSFRSAKPASPLLTSDLIRQKVTQRSWATPRHGMLRACNYLTSRSIRDLPTQIRFEKNTVHRNGGVSPEFVEWLMGYPRKWTAV